MPSQSLSPQDQSHMIWVCRRLAAALHGEDTLVSALDRLARSAPKGPRRIASAMRESLRTGKQAADGLLDIGLPWFVFGTIKAGELGAMIGPSVALLADRLELEQQTGRPKNRKLFAYSLALGRMGLMLGMRAPMLTALETAANSVPGSHAQRVLMGARDKVCQGADLSEALKEVKADLPEGTLDMIRDGEKDSRLPEALSVVSDYLLDEAGAARRAPVKEV